jgi:transposase InsO family protein
MKKDEIRKEFFKLKNKGHSYSQCRVILKAKYNFDITTRTLKRWIKRLDSGGWDLCDKSRRPHTIRYKITPTINREVISLREKTGWGCDKLTSHLTHLNLSRTSIHRILQKHNRCRDTKNRGKRKKWVRWQREHPNSLWQMDHTDEKNKFNCYTLSVLDDCSRYSIALVKLTHVTTSVVTHVLDELIKKHGKPKQILTDNGSAYGSKSKHSKFDRWCRRRGIQHIRTKVHSPTTNGKVERLFKTMDEELEFCNNDLELFRMRYNHFRPHSSLNGKSPAGIYHDFAKLF